MTERPLQQLKGVGSKVAEALSRLHLHTIEDVLFHLPVRYEDRTVLTPLASFQLGMRVQGCGQVVSSRWAMGRKRSFLVTVQEAADTVVLRFFYTTLAQRNALAQVGARVFFFGEVRRHHPSGMEIVHPEYTILQEDQAVPLSTSLRPIYSVTKGVSQALIRRLVQQALQQCQSTMTELLPATLLHGKDYPTLYEALSTLHAPPTSVDMTVLLNGRHPAQQRLAFEELLAHRLSLQFLRRSGAGSAARAMRATSQLCDALLESLPFSLTPAQQRVVDEVAQDVSKTQPMMRLVQGDVGSGKTVVAALAAAQCVDAGFQAALMAPTEILAEQHFQKFKDWFAPLGITVGWLAGRHTAAHRREFLADLHAGKIQIAIGTHALFQSEVQFKSLALVIIDEQHRFGVQQRRDLSSKTDVDGGGVHQLVMTATPIPRTLAMTVYADMDISTINELPPGRQPIHTSLISNQKRSAVIARVSEWCAQGRQVYWVCTLVETSEVLACEAAEEMATQLKTQLSGLRIGLVHGKMKSAEKEAMMQAFKSHALDILVATTVVEVGVDVPNASLIVIENPERLGLAQLHQLRGRVGRGSEASYCVLLYRSPLSKHAAARLKLMRETQDGFKIARLDLEMRGPGEVLGTQQSGDVSFRVADIVRDQHLIEAVKQASDGLDNTAQDALMAALFQRWIGSRQQYYQA